MADIEKDIAGLKHCYKYGCIDCPYYDENEECELDKDAIELIEEKRNPEHVHWKAVKAVGGYGYPYNDLECSGCGYRTKMIPAGWYYCPHCGKPTEDKPKRRCTEPRHKPGYWNGLNGGTHYGQYFDMEDVNRVAEMMEIASVLTEYGVKYVLSKLKRNYRITITREDYSRMSEPMRKRILKINCNHDRLNGEGGML